MPPLESTPGQFTYMYARPALTVDAIVVAAEEEPKVLLILRKNQPFQGMWATPGGYVDDGEPLDTAVARELQEETSIDPASIKLIQIGTFGDPGRDPRCARARLPCPPPRARCAPPPLWACHSPLTPLLELTLCAAGGWWACSTRRWSPPPCWV